MSDKRELLQRCHGAFCGDYVDMRAEIERLRRAVEFYGPSKPGSADLAGVSDDEWINRLVECVDG